MKTASFASQASLGSSLVLLAVFLAAGCSNKEQPPAATAPSGATISQTANPAQAAAPAAQPTPPNTAVNAGIAQAQAAMQARQYEQAANTLANLRTNNAPMTGKQLMSLNRAQADLQNQLSAAAAAGDPQAKAAYEMMRQRALYHQ